MEYLRHVLGIYAVLGLFISGGLFFNKKSKASMFLGLFISCFCIEIFDFLYTTSNLLPLYPEYFLSFYSLCLLSGPLLWFHIVYYNEPKANIKKVSFIWHLIPFLVYITFTIYLFQYSGTERLNYYTQNFQSVIVPLNYIKVLHVLFYGVLIFVYLKRKQKSGLIVNRQYMQVLTIIYLATAVALVILTAFSNNYDHFILYFVSSSSFLLFSAYMLFFKPEFLEKIKVKYAKSSLTDLDKMRISKKIDSYFSIQSNYVMSSLNFDKFCKDLNEKKHHVSQTLSDSFNMSFRDMLNMHRVNFAKELLVSNTKEELKIFAVALESGFTNKSTFNRAFTKLVKCTPLEYREEYGLI